MAKSKKTARQKREEEKKKRLNKLAKLAESSKTIIDENQAPSVTADDLRENAKIAESAPQSVPMKKEYFDTDTSVFKTEKSALQRELAYMKDPEIHDMPDFLTDPHKATKRMEVMEKINYLLKHRFSLITVADILECSDYDRLDEIIEQKEKLYRLVEKYTSEDGHKPFRIFSGLKKVVGDEYSRIYSEQEERMKAIIGHISDGKYFKDASSESPEDVQVIVEDIIAKIIDHPDFSLACQVEAEFVSYETEKAMTMLSDLSLRAEVRELIDELSRVSAESDRRAHSYQVINGLLDSYTKKPKKIIEKTEEVKPDNIER